MSIAGVAACATGLTSAGPCGAGRWTPDGTDLDGAAPAISVPVSADRTVVGRFGPASAA
jgi:hypothetical protein